MTIGQEDARLRLPNLLWQDNATLAAVPPIHSDRIDAYSAVNRMEDDDMMEGSLDGPNRLR